MLVQYIQARSPVNIKLDERILEVDRQREGTPGSGNGTENGTSPTSSGGPPGQTGVAARVGVGVMGASIFGVVAGLHMY